MTTSIAPNARSARGRSPLTADTGPAGDGRAVRFAEAVERVRVTARSIRVDERLLLLVGGALVPLGAIVVLLGWWGAAHSPYVFDQIPYVISGGLLGLGLIFLGAFLYFAYWLTELLKQQRAQSAAVLDALARLERLVPGASTPSGSAVPATDVGYVATQRGTMAHRPECVVVAGKTGLRPVTAADGLSSCKLCGET